MMDLERERERQREREREREREIVEGCLNREREKSKRDNRKDITIGTQIDCELASLPLLPQNTPKALTSTSIIIITNHLLLSFVPLFVHILVASMTSNLTSPTLSHP